MSIPNEALEKLVREIESQALVADQQIGLVRSQIASKHRQLRLVKLTTSEISALPKNTPTYEGIGKMFVASPSESVVSKLETQAGDIESDIEGLGKRLVYLETTAKNSKDHIGQMLKQQS